jgi:hypothetical protein
MKIMPLKEAYQLLENASAVIIEDDIVLYPSLWELRDDDTNEFLFFRWDDGGLEYDLTFKEGNNQDCTDSSCLRGSTLRPLHGPTIHR